LNNLSQQKAQLSLE